jgi:hypothetical protein
VPSAGATLADSLRADAAGPFVLLADASEFQPNIVDPLYLQWSKAIIIRAMYGDAHDDNAWFGGARRADLHKGGVRFLGIYQYVVQTQDPVAQARALASLIGKLQPGEKIIADIEEGSGSQQSRWVAWADEINRLLGHPPWDYSGLNFAATHGLAPVDWVAAYGTSEPSEPHKLWQFTDAFSIPGIGTTDCSVFHGTIDELAALAYQEPVATKYAEQPTGVHADARYTNATIWFEPGPRTEEIEVYLTKPDGRLLEKVAIGPNNSSHEFHKLLPLTHYKLGVLAKPTAPGAQAQYAEIRTR